MSYQPERSFLKDGHDKMCRGGCPISQQSSTNPQMVLKKQSPNGLLTVYLSRRELIVEEGGVVKPIDGVVLTDSELASQNEPFKIFALVVLTFRYGREDEEVMGLKFYTEAILHYEQWQQQEPSPADSFAAAPAEEARPDAHAPHTVSVSGHAPHSVGLKARPSLRWEPLGVTYDLKVFP
ncbi:arrestin, partial [Caerostris extrusa]